DGEGCFCLHSHTATSRFRAHIYACAVHVGNTDPRMLQWIATRFGGSIKLEPRPQSNRKPIWRWFAHTNDMDIWLPLILPVLVIKRDRAELLIAYRATLPRRVRTHRSTHDTTDSVKHTRADIHAKLSLLNKRGI